MSAGRFPGAAADDGRLGDAIALGLLIVAALAPLFALAGAHP